MLQCAYCVMSASQWIDEKKGFIISAMARAAYVRSYFWEDGDGLLEFFAQISKKSKRWQQQAAKEIKMLIDSVEIVEAD